MVEDWRSQVVGGMESALTMWEACCVPSLLHGAGTWVEITPAAERALRAADGDESEATPDKRGR